MPGVWINTTGGTADPDTVRDAGRWEVLLDESEQPVSTGDGDWLYVWIEGA